MKKVILLPLLLAFAGCGGDESLQAIRKNFPTKVQAQVGRKEPVETAPPSVFKTIKFPAPVGQLAAYLTPDPGDGKKHPAIIWITGGDCNSIGDVWSPRPRRNDQSAAAFRQAGVVMMFPSLRGGNDNPGQREGFFGEIDDILAAADFLQTQSYVDAKRIYLGGHSTGGTTVLLASEVTDRFRAVFSLGPVDDVSGYGPDNEFLPIDVKDQAEVNVRSPGLWLECIKSPTWVIEGSEGNSNWDCLRAMNEINTNQQVHFVEVPKADHFNVIGPLNEMLARKVLQDTGETCNITLSASEISLK